MRITISGTAGSGKSTIANAIGDEFKLKQYNIGNIRRALAKEKGMSLQEYNLLGEKDSSTDVDVDNYQKNIGKTKDHFLIEGRTSFYFVPNSLKIYIKTDIDEAAKRILNDLQKKDNNRNELSNIPKNINEMKEHIKSRLESDRFRYKKYYDLDINEESHYDYVLDTTTLSIKEAIEHTILFIKKYFSKN